MIEKIHSDNFRFISIQGPAGSGKTAFCRMLLEGEELVLYCRAEHLLEVSDVNCLWNLNLKDVFQYLNGKKIVIFIDALEFISDHRTKIDILQNLYRIAKLYQNVYVLTTCRTSEKSAFIRMDAQQEIHNYDIGELSDTELKPLIERYSIRKCSITTRLAFDFVL